MPRVPDSPQLPGEIPSGPAQTFLQTLRQALVRWGTQVATRLNSETWLLTSKAYPLTTPRTTQAQITVGASPFTYTNNDGTVEAVYLIGGTGLSIQYVRNTTTAGVLNMGESLYILSPLDKLIVTYTGAPTMLKVPF